MAQYSLHAYDADVWLERFLGLQQAEEINSDIRYAAEAKNVETPDGVLQPHAGYTLMDGQFDNRVETLAKFTRRWYRGNGSKDWLVCATGGHLYSRQVGSDVGWIEIPLPGTVTAYLNNVWSYSTYELNENSTEEDPTDPVDVLLMSNADDGMIVIIPPDRPSLWADCLTETWANPDHETWEDDYSPKWVIRPVDTQGYKFGVIERYAERIWGGAVAGEPDLLVYSRPYLPLDWTAAGTGEQPEDGAGDVRQPSWDGDSFKSLRAFGDQLIAFKEHRVWRVYGTDPGEYTFKEQYGGGAPFPNTVAVDVERIFFADADGLNVYDGMSVTPYARDQLQKIWRTVNKEALDQMCGAWFKRKYYLAIPVNGSTVNNALVIYDQDQRTFLYYEDMNIESLLATNEILYATSSTLPGRVLMLGHDSWQSGLSSGAATKWMTPWITLGNKKIQKGGFEFYFTPEVQESAVEFVISIQTEKKLKTKHYTVYPLKNIWRDFIDLDWEDMLTKTWQEVYDSNWNKARFHRDKRLHFSGSGRRFRLIIETPSGNTAPWRLIGGIQMVVETDTD